ncbi:hypothetical protein BJX99DRAFT_257098 [Aspergillus californicus]
MPPRRRPPCTLQPMRSGNDEGPSNPHGPDSESRSGRSCLQSQDHEPQVDDGYEDEDVKYEDDDDGNDHDDEDEYDDGSLTPLSTLPPSPTRTPPPSSPIDECTDTHELKPPVIPGNLGCTYSWPSKCIINKIPDPPLRKVVSHIFGRNKKVTKRIPVWIWEYWCRRHYQRTRYRSSLCEDVDSPECDGKGGERGGDRDEEGEGDGDSNDQNADPETETEHGKGEGSGTVKGGRGKKWADQQCEFVLEALRRIGVWGEVAGFLVKLRKREAERLGLSRRSTRVRRVSFRVESPISTEASSASAPAPAQDDSQSQGQNNGEAPTPKPIQSSISETASEPVPTSASTSVSSPARNTRSRSRTTSTTAENSRPRKKRQARPAVAAPVPDWLVEWIRNHHGKIVALEQVRDIVLQIQSHTEDVELEEGEEIRFPDIEILPVFSEAGSVVKGSSGRNRVDDGLGVVTCSSVSSATLSGEAGGETQFRALAEADAQADAQAHAHAHARPTRDPPLPAIVTEARTRVGPDSQLNPGGCSLVLPSPPKSSPDSSSNPHRRSRRQSTFQFDAEVGAEAESSRPQKKPRAT